jgi:hypothetical protein
VTWFRQNKNLNATLRLKHRIVTVLRTMKSKKHSVLWFSIMLEELRVYKFSTILRYTRIALSHRPEERSTPEMRRRLTSLTALKNTALMERPDPALTLNQLKAAVGSRRSTSEMAVFMTWVTASRLRDWEATKLYFHPGAVEIRYERPWKTDPQMSRRVVKWVPLGDDSPRRWKCAWRRLRTTAGRATVITHLMQRTGRSTGHAIRHAAIRHLQGLGQTTEDVTRLTYHRLGPSTAVELHYMATWTPREAATSQTCYRMANLLRLAIPGCA